MTHRMAFANRKGGCGKTTTVVNTAHALALKGRKVLVVDIDPQSHATICFGLTGDSASPGIFHLLTRSAPLNDVICKTSVEGLSLIPSSRELMSFEIDYSPRQGSETILNELLFDLAGEFDYIIFDSPPTVGILTVSALTAADSVYIPMPMHFLAMEGLAEMMRLIYTVNANSNPDLRLRGIIPTFFNKNTRIAKEITNDIAANFGKGILFPAIRLNVSLAEAPGHGKSVLEYAPNSSGSQDYKLLADRIDKETFK